MIYAPDVNYQCYVLQDKDVLRAYVQRPTNNTTVSYRDYFINSSYLYKDGYQTFSQYQTLPVCLDKSVITDKYFYRLDIDKIMIVFFVILCISYVIIKKIIRVFFHGFKEA